VSHVDVTINVTTIILVWRFVTWWWWWWWHTRALQYGQRLGQIDDLAF
jgi:hypothetical protein